MGVNANFGLPEPQAECDAGKHHSFNECSGPKIVLRQL